MANTLKVHQSNVICGLGSYTHTVANTGMYCVTAHCEENPTSSIVITLSQAGSVTDSASSTAATTSQNHIEIKKVFNCTAGDVLTVALVSADAIDNQLNNVKTIVVINQGSN